MCRRVTSDSIVQSESSKVTMVLCSSTVCHIAWNSPRTSFYGRKLFNYLQGINGINVLAPHSPTHIYLHTWDTVIDLAILKRIPFHSQIRVKNDLNSDHLPVILTLDTGSFPIYSPEHFSTNWENFRHILSFKPLPPCKITSNDAADNAVGCLSKILKETLAEASTQKFKDPPEKLPIGIRDKIHLRNYFRKQWQRTRDPEFRREFYRIKDEIAEETKQHLLQKRAEQIASLTPDSRSLWRRSKLLRKPYSPIPPLRGETGYPALAPIEKAEVLADSLRKQFEPNTDPIFDNPIVSGCLSKVFESVLLRRLNQFLDDNNIIISEQFGFRKKLSTNHQLVRVTELIHDGFEKSETTGALFLDIAKAFDKIWHDGLLLKLMRLGVSAQLIKILRSYLTSRNFQVRINHIISSPRPILSGCAQGSLLSPTRFNICVNDIPKTRSCHLAIFADDTAILTKHKDPRTIITRLQHYISQLQLWLTDWKIKVNPNKCACLLFTRKHYIPPLPSLEIFGQPVPRIFDYKYLGLHLDPKLSFNVHINNAIQKATIVSTLLSSLVARWSTLPIKHKILLYKAIIRPVLMYGSQVWGSTSLMNIKKVQVFQNKQLMHIVNAPWYVRRKAIHDDLKIEPISEFIKKTSTRFFNKIPQIRNELLQTPVYDPALPSSRKRPRTAMDAVFVNFPQVKRLRADPTPANLGV
ncbi:RNA-directed DNA polymerase from mobile element jockey [Araneus ventricosus]|uniref:RNA-directed DNA polymerase from mobile element jockey n=1 Tax=Araneus ventricosus TaxID=182803 RepID=A0A4Y2DLY1_ARAVE|nr:RNA-directed DNA polymerase from mobile element jockey [Araneus ventricosus]